MFLAFLGADNCLYAFRLSARYSFADTFGSAAEKVHYESFIATQLVVMVALFLVGMDLRDEKCSAAPRKSTAPVDSRDPLAIDAEIVEENETPNSANHNPRRLHE